MAETSVAPNNRSISFKRKVEREMPSVSQDQNRFMHAVAEGKVKDVPKKVGKDFVAADHGRKIGKLPKHVKKKIKRGLISEKAAKRHFGG